jgi:hypothetical protein
LRNAMRFIYGDQRYIHFLDTLYEDFSLQAFR